MNIPFATTRASTLEFVIVSPAGRVILQATTSDAAVRLSRTNAFAGTPMRVVFGTLQPIDTDEYDAYHGIGNYSPD